MKINSITIVFLTAMLGLMISSCSKMNDLHDGYLKKGETIYVGQPDSVKVFAGNGRVLLRYWVSDPKAAKMLIYWNSRQDSMIVDIPSNTGKQPIDVIVPDLSENKYFFQLITLDKDMKNPSIPLEASGDAYGDRFQASLLDRKMMYANQSGTSQLTIRWHGAAERGLGTNLKYKNTAGEEVERFVRMDEFSTILPDFKSDLTFRTSFLPDTNSIDTFYTEYRPVNNIDRELNAGLFAKWNPPGIPHYELNSTYSIMKLWDNTVETFYIANVPRLPHSFTFDLGQTRDISRIKQWQRLTGTVVYRIQNVRRFEVWGSDNPNVTEDFSGWTRLGVFESHKPSGLPHGQESPEDLAYAAAGEDFMTDADAPPVRYIRYVVLSTWDNKPTIAIAQLKFFSDENETD